MVEELVGKSLSEAIEKHKHGAVIMMELSEEAYFRANLASIKFLTDNGFEGVYISFHRPFRNLSSLLANQGVDINRLLFIDVATAFGMETQDRDPKCVSISSKIDIDELVRATYTSVPRLKGNKKFIFIDSLTTITLYKPLSETMRFSEFLLRTVRKNRAENITVILNVAKDLAQRKFIRDIALDVDEVISIL